MARRPGPSLEREAAAWAERRLLVGVDEVGRGPLAGPVVAAAAVFPIQCALIPGVRDSKTLSAPRRVALASAIGAGALAIGLGAASCHEIDRLNIRVATALAMQRAVRRALRQLDASRCTIVVDGLPVPELGYPHEALVGGDALCYSIAAAGIVAKNLRDRLMERLAARHPGYEWASNMGYGTRAHVAALVRHGATPHHRHSFAPVSQLGRIG
ncbi:MAG: ribonuclease HII [Gemmatimonadales bacterium]